MRQVCHAVWSHNYRTFFAIHESSPCMGAFLLDQLVEPMRKFAMTAILRAYRPLSLPLPFVAEQLGFAGDDAHARVAKFTSYVPRAVATDAVDLFSVAVKYEATMDRYEF